MEANTARYTRTTTGTVHAGHVVTEAVREFTATGWVDTEETTTRVVLACGWAPNTVGSRTAAVVETAAAPVTCAKCAKAIA